MKDTLPEKEHADTRTALALNTSPDAVRVSRERYNADPVIHAILLERIDAQLAQCRRKLDSCAPDELRGLQAEIRTFETAKTLINQRE